jgi:hypothetical protein
LPWRTTGGKMVAAASSNLGPRQSPRSRWTGREGSCP